MDVIRFPTCMSLLATNKLAGMYSTYISVWLKESVLNLVGEQGRHAGL